MVGINRGAPHAEDAYHKWPKEQWRGLLAKKRYFLAVQITHDCRCLVQFVEEASEMWAALGFTSLDDMIRTGLELEPAEIHAACDWLKANDPARAVSLTTVLRQQGGDRRSATAKKIQGATSTLKRGSTSRAYRLARLDRDRPDLAERVRGGDLSAAAAAREAGFADATITLPLHLERAQKKLEHYFTPEALRRFCPTCGLLAERESGA